MRRFLTVCLVLLALLALCIGVGAAKERFTDSHLIKNTNEVLMLTDLGLFSGYTDGSFRPGNTITRAEIAKLMAAIDTANLSAQTMTAFTDAVPAWAASYVSYCVQQGILSTYADGSFRPNANITGRELAKMLLTVVGHDPKQFTGAQWAETVDAAAKEAGLYDGYTQDLNLFISRDDACLMINNALQCSYISGYGADGKPQYVLDSLLTPKSLLETRFGVVLVTGVVEANAVADLRDGATGPLENELIHISGYTRDFKVSAQVASDPAILGRKMKLYASFSTDFNRVVGVPLARSTEVYTQFSDLTAVNTLLQYAPQSVTEKTRIFTNLQPGTVKDLENRGDGATATIIDHEGDGQLEYILITRPETEQESEEETPAQMRSSRR